MFSEKVPCIDFRENNEYVKTKDRWKKTEKTNGM